MNVIPTINCLSNINPEQRLPYIEARKMVRIHELFNMITENPIILQDPVNIAGRQSNEIKLIAREINYFNFKQIRDKYFFMDYCIYRYNFKFPKNILEKCLDYNKIFITGITFTQLERQSIIEQLRQRHYIYFNTTEQEKILDELGIQFNLPEYKARSILKVCIRSSNITQLSSLTLEKVQAIDNAILTQYQNYYFFSKTYQNSMQTELLRSNEIFNSVSPHILNIYLEHSQSYLLKSINLNLEQIKLESQILNNQNLINLTLNYQQKIYLILNTKTNPIQEDAVILIKKQKQFLQLVSIQKEVLLLTNKQQFVNIFTQLKNSQLVCDNIDNLQLDNNKQQELVDLVIKQGGLLNKIVYNYKNKQNYLSDKLILQANQNRLHQLFHLGNYKLYKRQITTAEHASIINEINTLLNKKYNTGTLKQNSADIAEELNIPYIKVYSYLAGKTSRNKFDFLE